MFVAELKGMCWTKWKSQKENQYKHLNGRKQYVRRFNEKQLWTVDDGRKVMIGCWDDAKLLSGAVPVKRIQMNEENIPNSLLSLWCGVGSQVMGHDRLHPVELIYQDDDESFFLFVKSTSQQINWGESFSSTSSVEKKPLIKIILNSFSCSIMFSS